MSNAGVRTRFAPAPTGLMHLGNVRTALMNYLFSRQTHGTFIVRIEDTDQQRNFDPGAHQILNDLQWLALSFDEGPGKGGPYEPYFQSQRTDLYIAKLQILIDNKAVYRCFCTSEELERKRQRQITLKLPPRYDRLCAQLAEQEIEKKCAAQIPFIWRLKIPQQGSVEINDLARGTVHFDFKHFSDHPLTRQDGSITFLFANFVDDLDMRITHIFRGEDHLTNTAIQTVLYKAFNAPLPIYWHMPILCNIEGKKLSKRDFGFSLQDLRQAGYLPEAICNYLAIIGGGTFEKEIMSMEELIKHVDFQKISAASQIKYDAEKLRWMNHHWIEQYNSALLAERCRPFLEQAFPQSASLDQELLIKLIQIIKSDMATLRDCVQVLHFYFMRPELTLHDIELCLPTSRKADSARLIARHLHSIDDPKKFMANVKASAQEQKIPLKEIFAFLRLALMGQPEGPSIHDLIDMLGVPEATQRIKRFCSLIEA